MEKRFKQLVKKARSLTMDKKDKDQVRSSLLAFVKKDATAEVEVYQTLKKTSGFRLLKPMPILAGLVLAAMIGGGVSFASENSLPGDFLYPIKIGVNEEVRAVFTISSEAKAEWETRRAERRLEEADGLLEKGGLNEEKIKKIRESFTKHADNAERELGDFGVETENVMLMEAASIAPQIQEKAVDFVEAAEDKNGAFGLEKARVAKIREKLRNKKLRQDL